jgi:hypothetical protein
LVKVIARMRARATPSLDEARDPLRDDARLAGAGAREDEERPQVVLDRLSLARVQSVDRDHGSPHRGSRGAAGA